MTQVADNFNRADENPLAGNWTTTIGHNALQIVTNECAQTSGDCSAYWNTDLATDDNFAQFTHTTAGFNNGPVVRNQKTAASMFLYSGTDHTRSKFTAGAYVSLEANDGTTWNSGDIVKLSIVGTTLQAYQNGTPVGTGLTDSSFPTGRTIGAFIGFLSPFDNFVGGDVVDPSNIPTQRSRGLPSLSQLDAEDEGHFNELDVRNWW